VVAGPLEALSRLGEQLADGIVGDEAIQLLAVTMAEAAGADLVVVWALDPDGESASVRTVAAARAALEAEAIGASAAIDELADPEVDELDRIPRSLARIAEGADLRSVLQLPVRLDGRPLGAVTLLNATAFTAEQRAAARVGAAEAAFLLEADRRGGAAGSSATFLLDLTGWALAAGVDQAREAEAVARLAAEATGATSAALWLVPADEPEAPPELVAAVGAPARGAGAPRIVESGQGATLVEGPARDESTALVRVGRPPLGMLQLVFPRGAAPGNAELEALAAYGTRAADALRSGRRARAAGLELERTRALLAVVSQAIAQLSLAHTLDTAAEQVARLIGVERVAVYLQEGDQLQTAAQRNLAGPHAAVAKRLLELALGPSRAGAVVVEDAEHDARLGGVSEAVTAAGVAAAHAVPLTAHGEVIGLLAVYLRRRRPLGPADAELLDALATQLAVAVENARLHERTKQLGAELEEAFRAERRAARRLGALYEISSAFAQSLSLEMTLDAVVRTAVELLEVDAAVIRMPDERGDSLVAQAIHAADGRMEESMRAIFAPPQPVSGLAVHRLLRRGEPFDLDRASAAQLGGSHALLVPFLEKGSTAVVLPIATPAEVLATLTLLSLDPARPISNEAVESALSLARQAALALDNARLYQQQKRFSDAMQRSLLPRGRPAVPGLELGDVYESSAQLDVGGDVYDYLVLADGRLAVCLGDVTGHGVDAAADMAMGKFVFRSLAREHPEPASFLAHANEIICDDVSLGRFVTMLYVTIDPANGRLACGSAGHPPPRLVHGDGTVEAVRAAGLVLGIEPGQLYDEVQLELAPSESVVLYTDGVVEARRGPELYGEERLDELLADQRGLAPDALAVALLEDCRRFSRGELADDVAVVVVRRMPV
jgi:serine phosphatase RsbU (regulator of sigma subunit)